MSNPLHPHDNGDEENGETFVDLYISGDEYDKLCNAELPFEYKQALDDIGDNLGRRHLQLFEQKRRSDINEALGPDLGKRMLRFAEEEVGNGEG